jgi:hypothetical protein
MIYQTHIPPVPADKPPSGYTEFYGWYHGVFYGLKVTDPAELARYRAEGRWFDIYGREIPRYRWDGSPNTNGGKLWWEDHPDPVFHAKDLIARDRSAAGILQIVYGVPSVFIIAGMILLACEVTTGEFWPTFVLDVIITALIIGLPMWGQRFVLFPIAIALSVVLAVVVYYTSDHPWLPHDLNSYCSEYSHSWTMQCYEAGRTRQWCNNPTDRAKHPHEARYDCEGIGRLVRPTLQFCNDSVERRIYPQDVHYYCESLGLTFEDAPGLTLWQLQHR